MTIEPQANYPSEASLGHVAVVGRRVTFWADIPGRAHPLPMPATICWLDPETGAAHLKVDDWWERGVRWPESVPQGVWQHPTPNTYSWLPGDDERITQTMDRLSGVCSRDRAAPERQLAEHPHAAEHTGRDRQPEHMVGDTGPVSGAIGPGHEPMDSGPGNDS